MDTSYELEGSPASLPRPPYTAVVVPAPARINGGGFGWWVVQALVTVALAALLFGQQLQVQAQRAQVASLSSMVAQQAVVMVAQQSSLTTLQAQLQATSDRLATAQATLDNEQHAEQSYQSEVVRY
jgi:hypothetical protein